MKVVYIASPYTNGSQAENVRQQLEVANELINLGYCPIAPLLSHFQQIVFPQNYETWLNIDFELIKRSDIILRLDGKSNGADLEVDFAEIEGKEIIYSIKDLETLK